MASTAFNPSKPNIELAHIQKANKPQLFDSHLVNCERDRVMADAEAYHRKTPGIGEPTNISARRYLAIKYPSQYRQWSCLVETKGMGKIPVTQGQPAAATTLGGGTTFRGHHEASRGRGRGRGGYAAKRNGSGGFARGSQDTTSRLLSSTSTKALQTRGCSAHFNSQARNGPNKGTAGVASADPSASSLKFQTYEEWEADKVRRGRKQEEEETARLLEENERAMYIDLPTDTESLPSQSISTGAASEPPRSLPRYMVLEPMRKTPASVASSSGVSSTKLVSSSSALPATKEVVESTKIPPQGTPELDQPFFVGIGNKHQEIKDPVPVIPAPSGFRAPDWRARGKTEPQPCWSDAGSEMAASENELRGETNSGKAENVDKITAEWDRVLLGSD